MPETSQRNLNISTWIKMEEKEPHKVKALENASRHFDENDSLTVHLLEAIYGQESSFGEYRRTRNLEGAAGDFQLEKNTAKRYNMKISKNNDPRFDIDNASDVAARYLKNLDAIFSQETILAKDIYSFAIKNKLERKKFVIAAYNGGEGIISIAQDKAYKDGKDPGSWEDVKKYLAESGASKEKIKEILNYLDAVMEYEKAFEKKSKADPKIKHKRPLSDKTEEKSGKWITVGGKHIVI